MCQLYLLCRRVKLVYCKTDSIEKYVSSSVMNPPPPLLFQILLTPPPYFNSWAVGTFSN